MDHCLPPQTARQWTYGLPCGDTACKAKELIQHFLGSIGNREKGINIQ